MTIEECTELTAGATIAVEERGRRFEIRNPKRIEIRKVRIDGCVIDDHRQRCDFLFEIDGRCAAYVELKGSDVTHAFSQLSATLSSLRPRHSKWRVSCFIVASRVPRIAPQIQQLKRRLALEHRAQTKLATTGIGVDVESDLPAG